jgi:hypothetical protein
MVGRRRSLVHSALRKAILAASPPALRREMLDLTASLVEEDAGLAKDRRRAKDAELSHPCLRRPHAHHRDIPARRLAARKAAAIVTDRSNFRSLSQAALTLDQSQLMERTMLCPRITQQSLRKPLDAGCFEGDSTKAGPKPPVQLYERDDLRSHLQNFSTRNAVISTAYGEWCNGSLSGSGPNPVLQCHPILIRLFPATSEQFAKL